MRIFTDVTADLFSFAFTYELSKALPCLNCFEFKSLHTCFKCKLCCECVTCSKCYHVQIQPLCGSCGLCPIDCRCFRCSSCGLIGPLESEFCEDCKNGKQCCCLNKVELYSARSLLGKRQVNLHKYSKLNAITTIANPTTRLLSAEIELCGLQSPTKLSYSHFKFALESWGASVVYDGTLPKDGFEINTHPAAGDYWVNQIQDIMSTGISAGAWVDSCAGCHIHVDCRDLGYLELARVLRVLGCVEFALFQLTPKERIRSTHCVPWTFEYVRELSAVDMQLLNESNLRVQTTHYRHIILTCLYGFHSKENVYRFKKVKHHINRYRAINIHSFMYRGTIEFRIPNGTIYADSIINWGILCSLLIDYAVSHSMSEIKELTKNVEENDRLDQTVLKEQQAVLDTIVSPYGFIQDWIQDRLKWRKTLVGAFYEGPLRKD